jgi:predicted amidohydrolase YtcJ
VSNGCPAEASWRSPTIAAKPTLLRFDAMPRPADVILTNGKIITVDADFRIAEAVAIAGDRIVAVGPAAEVAQFGSPATEVIDLAGRTVMPGLIDGHAHMDREGLKSVFPTLGRVRSIKDIQDRIADLARDHKRGEWIVTMPIGDPPYYFDMPELLAEKRWPTRQELDEAAPHNPVFIRSIWGFWRHTLPLVCCANTPALERAGIRRDTISPVETLEIEKDSRGDPTGVLYEHELQPIAELVFFRQAPGFTRADRARTLPAAARAYHAYGTTSIFEEHGAATELLRAYKDARGAGALSMRAALTFSPSWKAAGNVSYPQFIEAWAGWLGEPVLGDDYLKVTGLFVDVGRNRANDLRAQAAPYTGWAGFNYDTGRPVEHVKEILRACAHNDIRVVAIWPNMLDLFEELDREIPLAGRRWVIGHISTLSPRDVERIARMGLVVTTHTNRYVFKEGHLLQKKLPPERHREIAPISDLLSAGVKVALATDNVPVSLFWPVWQSIARIDRYTNERVAPEQALTREQALRCATHNGAYLTFDEDKKGSLEPGKLADLTVLSADPLTVEEVGIRDIAARMTMVGGQIVHESPPWRG